MTININNLNNQTQVHQNKQHKIAQDTGQTTQYANAKNIARDSVSLTPQVQQFKALQKKLDDVSVVDQKNIEALKKSIASGDYKINVQKLADNIAKFEFDLL